MIGIPTTRIIITKCFICLLLLLLCACKGKQKESTAYDTIQPDTLCTRCGNEKLEGTDWVETEAKEVPLQLKIYPSPARDDFYLELNEWTDGMEYVISNSSGQVILHGDIRSQKEAIDIRELQNGFYSVKVISQSKNSPPGGRLY